MGEIWIKNPSQDMKLPAEADPAVFVQNRNRFLYRILSDMELDEIQQVINHLDITDFEWTGIPQEYYDYLNSLEGTEPQ